MTYKYFCILCGFIAQFTKPLQQTVFKCPWCAVTVEARPYVEQIQNETVRPC